MDLQNFPTQVISLPYKCSRFMQMRMINSINIAHHLWEVHTLCSSWRKADTIQILKDLHTKENSFNLRSHHKRKASPHQGKMIISLSMNITMNQLGGASLIAKFHS